MNMEKNELHVHCRYRNVHAMHLFAALPIAELLPVEIISF